MLYMCMYTHILIYLDTCTYCVCMSSLRCDLGRAAHEEVHALSVRRTCGMWCGNCGHTCVHIFGLVVFDVSGVRCLDRHAVGNRRVLQRARHLIYQRNFISLRMLFVFVMFSCLSLAAADVSVLFNGVTASFPAKVAGVDVVDSLDITVKFSEVFVRFVTHSEWYYVTATSSH